MNVWVTVTSNGSPYAMAPLSVLSVSVTLVYCGQTVEWIKMPLIGTTVGIGPGDIVLNGEWGPSSPPPLKGAGSRTTATHTFRPMPIVAKGQQFAELLLSKSMTHKRF